MDVDPDPLGSRGRLSRPKISEELMGMMQKHLFVSDSQYKIYNEGRRLLGLVLQQHNRLDRIGPFHLRWHKNPPHVSAAVLQSGPNR